MKTAAILAILPFALALPALESRQLIYIPCTGLTGSAQCCATDVLGLADLDCAGPSTTPTSKQQFTDTCAGIGQRARCCAIPILGQALVCGPPN